MDDLYSFNPTCFEAMTSRHALFSLCIALIAGIPARAQSQADFFNPDILHEIRLESSDWSVLKEHYLENTRYKADLQWNFNGTAVGVTQVAIRSRGSGSRSPIKPSLKVEFDYYVPGQTFLGLKSFILRANTQDASMLHERVSFELMRRMGLPVSREAHTKIYVNGEYAGLYTIVETVDKAFVKRSFNEDTGYLYSYQYQDPFFFEDRGPDPATYSPIIFQPEFSGQTPNPAPIAAMVQTINHAPDAQFQSAVSQYVDFNSFLTVIAAENFLAEQDGLVGGYGLNNFYMYRFDGTTVHTFIPWDKSNTFWSLDWPIMHNIETNVLSRRAVAVPALLAIYRNALSRAATIAGGAGGWLEQEISKEYEQIREAAYADPFKLCDPGATGALRPCSNEQFDAAVADMINFARIRGADVQAQLSPPVSQQNFTISNPGAFTSTAFATASSLQTGYARIQTAGGATSLSGLAIFSLHSGEMVISEATIPASPLVQSGRIYVEVNGPVNTAIALANPNDQPATVSFYFTDAAGRDFGQATIPLPPNGQIAKFLDAAPFNSGTLVSGTFTFASSVPIGAIALRGLTNERSEFLMTTLPVTPTIAQPGTFMFPHLADGGGWTTQIILVNPSDQTLTGTIQFLSPGSNSAPGQPIVVATAESGSASSFSYSIPAHGAFRLRTTGASADVRVGSVRITPGANNGTPSGVAIFTFRRGGVTVSEAGVPASRPSSAFRLYAESSGDFPHSQAGATQTGIAISNSSATAAVVTLEVTNLDGTSAGLVGTLVVPANGQNAIFLNQVPGLTTLPASFQGVLRISSSAGLSVVALRGRYNERGDFLMTTTLPVAEDDPASAGELIFPHIVEGAGYTTQLVLFSGKPGPSSSGTLRLVTPSGQPFPLSIR